MAPALPAEGSWSYDYVPGAGDDEESWACGLSPERMWRHRDALVQAGPQGVHALLAELLQEPWPPPSAAEERHPATQRLPGDFSPDHLIEIPAT